MKKHKRLSAQELQITPKVQQVLRLPLPAQDLNPVCLFQPRARKALEMGVAIRELEYNIYVAGDSGLGRTFLVENFLQPLAAQAPPPGDLIFLNNFKDPDKPLLLQLKPGQGQVLKKKLQTLVKRLQRDIPRHFEQTSYLRSQNKLFSKLMGVRDNLLEKMEDLAHKKGFSLNFDDSGSISITPLIDGKVLTSEEFERLDTKVKKHLKDQSGLVLNSLADLLRLVNKNEQKFQEQELSLAQKHGNAFIERLLAPLRQQFTNHKQLKSYFDDFTDDVLENLAHFQGTHEGDSKSISEGHESPVDSFYERYGVNLFVDNAHLKGAPIIKEINPGFFNLLGCIERETEWGTYYTDFSLIKAGTIHRAHGGYLLLRVDDLLAHPASWEGLLRCLRTGQSRLEDPTDHYDSMRTRTITPSPIPLDLKVVLIGDDETYELLYMHDERFRKLFRIKAHIQDSVERTEQTMLGYAQILKQTAKIGKLRSLNKGALGELINYSTRLAEDKERLSLYFSHLREIMIEANALAQGQGQRFINAATIKAALDEREYRNNLYQEEFLREYDRRSIKVRTQGNAVGAANGLSVTQIGDYVMGLPHQISCTVGVGHGGIMDLEREAELGGPIHTKGMMILKSYFVNLFARTKPLVLTGSLYFEQSYAHVDGDSASGAELAALLSALSGIPLRLDLAFTGAISQSGAIMSVGGVTHKVEGYFEVCRRRGLTGTQGVLLPQDNIVHLVLKENIIQAVKDGLFHIYPVKNIEEAMEILTGVRAGQRLKNGNFSSDSIYDLVDQRLTELASMAELKSQPAQGQQKKARL